MMIREYKNEGFSLAWRSHAVSDGILFGDRVDYRVQRLQNEQTLIEITLGAHAERSSGPSPLMRACTRFLKRQKDCSWAIPSEVNPAEQISGWCNRHIGNRAHPNGLRGPDARGDRLQRCGAHEQREGLGA